MAAGGGRQPLPGSHLPGRRPALYPRTGTDHRSNRPVGKRLLRGAVRYSIRFGGRPRPRPGFPDHRAEWRLLGSHEHLRSAQLRGESLANTSFVSGRSSSPSPIRIGNGVLRPDPWKTVWREWVNYRKQAALYSVERLVSGTPRRVAEPPARYRPSLSGTHRAKARMTSGCFRSARRIASISSGEK